MAELVKLRHLNAEVAGSKPGPPFPLAAAPGSPLTLAVAPREPRLQLRFWEEVGGEYSGVRALSR